jgi:hypothetical protein
MLSFFDHLLLFCTILFHAVVLACALPITTTTFASPILQGYTLESLFRYEDYAAFQISGGVGGNALEEARSIFEGESADVLPRHEADSPLRPVSRYTACGSTL